MVQRTLIRPPASRLGPISEAEREKISAISPVAGQYDTPVDRESAFEILQKRAAEAAQAEEEATRREQEEDGREAKRTRWTLPDFGEGDADRRTRTTTRKTTRRRSSNRQSVTEAAIKSVARSVGTSLGRALVRGILGSLKRGR
jgi:hypothetical protein